MDIHQTITEDLHMRKICVKLVQKNLSDEQKDNCVLVSREILDRVKSEPNFLQQVITGDETWVSSMIPQPKDRVQSGTLPSHLDQKRPEWATQEWNPCSLFFLIQRE